MRLSGNLGVFFVLGRIWRVGSFSVFGSFGLGFLFRFFILSLLLFLFYFGGSGVKLGVIYFCVSVLGCLFLRRLSCL